MVVLEERVILLCCLYNTPSDAFLHHSELFTRAIHDHAFLAGYAPVQAH